jgi:hypothetical protein
VIGGTSGAGGPGGTGRVVTKTGGIDGGVVGRVVVCVGSIVVTTGA